jgi:hypothetical protein
MNDLYVSVIFMAAALIGLAVWFWRLWVWCSADYDIESFLHGSWAKTWCRGLGKASCEEETLRGQYNNLEILVKRRFWRKSLLSFGEYYNILVWKGDVPAASRQGASPRLSVATLGSLEPGVWQFTKRGEGIARGQVHYTIPVYRCVRTPFQTQAGLEQLLSRLSGLLPGDSF